MPIRIVCNTPKGVYTSPCSGISVVQRVKLVSIIGARPQFIKAAVVSQAITGRNDVEEALIHTGQHYDESMSDVFFKDMDIPAPKYHLGIGGMAHGAMTGRQIEAIEVILLKEDPDILMVYGDTNSTLAGALAAAKLHIPIAHVEAGLRSFNRRMPEEINRVLTDHVATWHFAPSQEALTHLANEGLTGERTVFTGDVMYDCALVFGAVADEKSNIIERLRVTPGGFRFCTAHRQENTDDPSRFENMFEALRMLAADKPLVMPLHPRTRKRLQDTRRFEAMTKGLNLIEPVGFFDMIRLLRAASLVVTDSGGVQKEAYFHKTPVVVMRDETEWSELVAMGWAKIAPPVSAKTVIEAAIAMEGACGDMQNRPYGDGAAAQKIVEHLTRI